MEEIILKKYQQIWQWGLGLIALVVLLLVTQVTLPAQAAGKSYQASDFLTSAKVTNGPDFKPAETIDIQYKLDFGDQELNAGDTITIDLPANLKAKTVGDKFDVLDTDGTVVGQAEVTSDGQVVITMNAALEGKTNDRMTLNLATKYRGGDYGEQNVIFNEDNQSVINIVENDANMSKKGTMQDDGTIKWTILVDRREINLKNLKISDTIGDHQTLIKDITVYEGAWTSTTAYKRQAEISSDQYDVTYHDKGFDLAFKDTVSNLVVIDYYTKIDADDELINSGYKFRNQAVMNWGGGTSGGSHSEEANGKVSTSNGNNGSGSGDENPGEGTEGPDTEKPGTEGPDTEGPDTEKPGTEGPSTEGPDTEKPTTEGPDTDTDGVETDEEPEDETTGTIDVDGGFAEDFKKPNPDKQTSTDKSTAVKRLKTTKSTTTDHNRAVAPAKRHSATRPTAAKSAQTVAKSKTTNRKLPQTNAAKQSLWRVLGGLLAGLVMMIWGVVRVRS